MENQVENPPFNELGKKAMGQVAPRKEPDWSKGQKNPNERIPAVGAVKPKE